MARKLASIVEISKVSPIENADRLEVVEMKGKGWKVVTQKGEFHVGDLGCYFEIDSYLPSDDERYAFLKERCLKRFVSKSGNVLREGIRIKTIKLRGVISQGLLMPIDKFPEIIDRIRDFKPEHVREGCISDEELVGKVFISETAKEYNERRDKEDAECLAENPGCDVPPREDYTDETAELAWMFHCCALNGADVTKLLKVEHYDEVKEQLQPQTGNALSADALGTFPSAWIPKSDEDRIQQNTEYFDKCKGMTFEITAKDDGTSCTIAFSPTIDFENPKIVCSRNLRLKRETASGAIPIYWQMEEKYHVLDKLSELLLLGKEWAVQGEIVGIGIQKNRDCYNECEFHVFRIWDIKNQKFVSPDERRKFCEEFDIPHVQVVASHYPFFNEITTIEDALKFAEGKTVRGHEREGIVLKQDDGNGDIHLKIVSNRYLLAEKD